MLKELVTAASRFREEGNLPPTGYKPKSPKWIINIEDKKAHLEGPYSKKEHRTFLAPDRQRSGPPSARNLKPFLLLDDARYVLGIPEEGKKDVSMLLHKSFVSLLRQAFESTGLPELRSIVEFLASSETIHLSNEIEPKDMVAIMVGGKDVIGHTSVMSFWADYLAEELMTRDQVECGVCGRLSFAVRILPREVVVFGRKCQVSSFNSSAFFSFGRRQTTNAPLCFACASSVVDALDYVIRKEQHHRTLWFNADARSLENQLAVFWLEKEIRVTAQDEILDIEAMYGDVLNRDDGIDTPPDHLSRLQRLLLLPWSASLATLNLDDTKFSVAIISANKGRLVVREWLKTDLGIVKTNVKRFLDATTMITRDGASIYPISIGRIIDALAINNPNITGGLLRTAYGGVKPPRNLGILAAEKLGRLLVDESSLKERNRRTREKLWDDAWLQALAAAIKLGTYYGSEEVEGMTELNPKHEDTAYLCGCLLAVLEEAEQVASYVKKGKRLGTTIVNRYYGGASSAPKGTFGRLMSIAAVAHLPDAGKEINIRLEEVTEAICETGGFPRNLSLEGQADFALGFYHQRAAFRGNRTANVAGGRI